jgi:hypothetical protein
MSFDACSAPNYNPVPIPPLRAGETDGRYIDVSTDLGVVGDSIPDITAVTIAIARVDDEAMTSSARRVWSAHHGGLHRAARLGRRALLGDLDGEHHLSGPSIHS